MAAPWFKGWESGQRAPAPVEPETARESKRFLRPFAYRASGALGRAGRAAGSRARAAWQRLWADVQEVPEKAGGKGADGE
jgi:hypothetical protein